MSNKQLAIHLLKTVLYSLHFSSNSLKFQHLFMTFCGSNPFIYFHIMYLILNKYQFYWNLTILTDDSSSLGEIYNDCSYQLFLFS